VEIRNNPPALRATPLVRGDRGAVKEEINMN